MVKETSGSQVATRIRKELAILKAENEMLESAKQNILLSDKYDDDEKNNVIEQITNAQSENLQQGKQIYGANEQDIKNVKYGKPSKHYIEKYNERLMQKGLTDEQIRTKDISDENANSSLISYGKQLEEEMDYNINENIVANQGRENADNDEIISIPYENDKMAKTDIKNNGMKSDKEEARVKYVEDDSFNISDIPDYVQYDILPLPSNGQCYKSKKSRVPVAYLTASDENIITAPNLYRDGKVIDLLLKRKVLDKTINVDELCRGDRDAIIIWLRATGYGVDFPVKVHDPDLDTDYETTIQLDKIKTKKFTLVGDENGWFDYQTKNGDNIKFKYINRYEEIELQKSINQNKNKQRKEKINNIAQDILNEIENDNILSDAEKNKITLSANLIKEWGNKILPNENVEEYSDRMTKSMILSTMSVNGNTDREYIKKYIENMRALEAYNYRQYVSDHEPGMDFNITVNRPERLGGGSFATFLQLDSFIFLNIAKL